MTHIIDNIYIGDVFSLTDSHKYEQVISIVKIPPVYKTDRCIEILFEDNSSTDIVFYANKIYPLLDNHFTTLINCQAGKSRSAACVVYYVMKKYDKTFEEALKIVKKQRPCIMLNKSFVDQLQQFNNN